MLFSLVTDVWTQQISSKMLEAAVTFIHSLIILQKDVFCEIIFLIITLMYYIYWLKSAPADYHCLSFWNFETALSLSFVFPNFLRSV